MKSSAKLVANNVKKMRVTLEPMIILCPNVVAVNNLL